MNKRIVSVIMVLMLVVCWSVPSFAFVATPSDAEEEWIGDDGELVASDSNWTGSFIDQLNQSLDLSEISSGENPLPVFASTVDMSAVSIQFYYVNAAGSTRGVVVYPDSSGHFNFERPDDYVSFDRISVVLKQGAIPNKGVYSFAIKLAFTAGGSNNWTGVELWNNKNSVNANSYASKIADLSFTSYFSDVYAPAKIDVTSPFYVVFRASDFTIDPRFNGNLYLAFGAEAPGATSDLNTNSWSSPQDTEDAIQSNTGQIAQNTASMNDTLREIVQTISQQLESLWHQMYNYIHLEDMANADANADKIVNALGSEISVQIQNDDRISQEIMDNDDKNTETIVNGYDDSGLNSSNEQLGGALDQHAEAEQQIMDQISDPLESFEFTNPVTQYLSTFLLFGDFLQDIFDNSGNFKDVINLSFLLGIALMVAGLYRFKGGN